MDDATLNLWAESLSPGMTAEDSIRSNAWRVQSETLPMPRNRSVSKPREGREEVADFQIGEKLGAGGMGVVYTARQTSINREVALKMIKPEHAASKSAAEALMSEAVVIGCLDHPNVVPVYDLGMDEDGRPFYAMKEVEGFPWNLLIGGKTLDENLDILMHVADAVAFAHAKGILHRDLKPQNIMLGSFGEIMVMDWGAACSLSGDNVVGLLPSDTAYCGTPAYMAPEMAKADKNRIGEASDVYLLGAMLYQVLSGRPPRCEKDPLICLAAAARNEIDPLENDGELARIALKAMAAAPADRFQSVEEFQQAIREYNHHAQSIVLLDRAKISLKQANERGDYDLFNRAIYNLRESISLWLDNKETQSLLKSAALDYGQYAMSRHDYELAQAQLDQSEPSHADLLKAIGKAIKERDLRKSRVRRLLITARVLLASFTIICGIGFFMIRAEQAETEEQRALVSSEHKQSLINLISAYYGEQNYGSAVAAFWDLHDQYGKEDLDKETLLKVRVASSMSAHRGSVNLGITNALKIVRGAEEDCIWVVGNTELFKIRMNAEASYDPDSTISIGDYKLGKHLPAGEVEKRISLPSPVADGAAVCESHDGTLWAGCGSILYRYAVADQQWNPVLDMSQIVYPPLEMDNYLNEEKSGHTDNALSDEKREEYNAWMNATGKALPITAILPDQEHRSAAIALGGGVVCRVELDSGRCTGWFHAGTHDNVKVERHRGSPILDFSPDQEWLLYREGSAETVAFVFRMPDLRCSSYFYGRAFPLNDVNFSTDQQLFGLEKHAGVVFSPSYADYSDSRTQHGSWSPYKYTKRSIPHRNWFFASLAPDNRRCAILTKEGVLFAGPTVEGQGFDFQQGIDTKGLIDCMLSDDGSALLLTENGRLHQYDTLRYSLRTVDLEGEITHICPGPKPDEIFCTVTGEDGKSRINRVHQVFSAHPVAKPVAAPENCVAKSCDPRGRWLSIPSSTGYAVLDLETGEQKHLFSKQTNSKRIPSKFTSGGDYWVYGGTWIRKRIFRVSNWEEILLEPRMEGAGFIVIEEDSEGFDHALVSGSKETPVIKSFPLEGHVSDMHDAIIVAVGTKEKMHMDLIPHRDPKTGGKRYWSRFWGDTFRLYDLEPDAPKFGNLHWRMNNLSPPVYNDDDHRVLLHRGGDFLEITLKTDLYPIFDYRWLSDPVEAVALNSDASAVFMISKGQLVVMKLADMEGE